MPERNINTVQVATSRRAVAMPWASRDALLGQFRHLDSMRSIVDEFEGVGTTRPVELTIEQKGDLLTVLDFWSNQIDGGYEAMPEGVYALRNGLHDDLHDAQQGG